MGYQRDRETLLRPTYKTLDEVRSQLSGFHFAKEALSEGELKLLLLAESLLSYIDGED